MGVPINLFGFVVVRKRLAQDLNVIVTNIVGDFMGEQVVDFVDQDGFSEHFANDSGRNLALSEAFNGGLPGVVPHLFIDLGLIIAFG